jgi:predicted nucleic acid-binding protein
LLAGLSYDNVEDLLESLEGRIPRVIVRDTNILLYACDSGSEKHAKAHASIEELFSGARRGAFPGRQVTAFPCVMTNPRLPGRRLALEEGTQLVQSWFDQLNVRLLASINRDGN